MMTAFVQKIFLDDKVSQGYALHYKSLYEWNLLAWIFKNQRMCVQFKNNYILEVICLLLLRKTTYAWNNLITIFYSLIFLVTIIHHISVVRQDVKKGHVIRLHNDHVHVHVTE
jgi:hypothetical protein